MTLKQARKAEALYQKSGNTKEARRIRVRIQEKFTLPAACLVFGLIGSAFGIRSFSRSSKSQGFGLSVLLIFLTFAWPVFEILDPSYTPTQVILTVIFAYLGMRLTYFVYSKNK